ncbi:MAG: hypothetical protein JO215_01435 [Ktedonobacteraceae bacterium]|nr:hypothetical protein [Ktedonobacteraceae bacterium]MBV9614886.1 hypothetical protein [Ktedonobacteraceae bacterium]
MDQSYPQRSRHTSPAVSQVSDKRRISFDDDEYDDVFPTRMPSSARRYHSDARVESGRTRADVQSIAVARDTRVPGRKNPIPLRSTATQTNVPAVRPGHRTTGSVDTEDVLPRRSRNLSLRSHAGHGWPRFHWSVYVGLAMLVMLIGWIALSSLASWWQVTQDDWHYGRPRTFQTDAVVGHDDSAADPSHFIAINLQRHVEIIEVPGGDAAKAKIYVGPVLIGQGQDLAVVKLSFKDVNGDGKPDMIVSIQDSRFVFINENGGFRPAKPGENVQL